uniref:Spermatid-specific protein S2 n=1 Tax=Scyliorhinus canicula TaxID=7830 RepID=SSS2_SCYCA|nr:RecName: Full=Spermatid-specific protein S2; AltName: Full=Basic nuclear protein S2 [Scyliorhinus canicula]
VKSRYHQRQYRARKRYAKARRTKKPKRRPKPPRKLRYAPSKKQPKIMKLKLDNEVDNTLKAKNKSLNEALKNRLSLRKHV